jgi:carboxypeptidase D
MLRLPVVLLALTAVSARIMTKHALKERQLEAAQHWQTSWAVEMGGAGDIERKRVQNITFTNPKASGG